VACPYFIPTQPHERELWAHRSRLPLGDGFAGRCGACAPDADCDDETLRWQCNLGYAECGRLPGEREFDAVRLLVQTESVGSEGSRRLRVQFVCEREHRPGWWGELRYDPSSRKWLQPPDGRLLALAEAAVRAWIGRQEEGEG